MSAWKSLYAWWLLEGNCRVSINAICMFGEDIARSLESILKDENDEGTLSEVMPGMTGRVNAICGRSLVSHFAFWTQRDYLERETDILHQYREIAGAKNACPAL